jgi:tetratricopeptide (TPR) repeat protein
MDIDDDAGARIKALRIERGLSQAQLAGPGLSASYLSLIESGARRPTPAVLQRLADRLGTSAEHLAHGGAPESWSETERRIAFAEMAIVQASAAEALAELDRLGEPVPAPFRDRALLARGKALEALGRHLDALACYEALQSRAQSGTAAWADRSVDVMRAYRDLGDWTFAAEFGERAFRVFEDLGLEWTDEAVRLGVTLAGVYRHRGDLTRARRLIERMLAAADQVGTPLARGSALWNAGMIAHNQGRNADALAMLRKAIALFGETEHLRNIAELRLTYAYTLYRTGGDPRQARAGAEEARALLEDVGNPTDRAHADIVAAEIDLLEGDFESAAARARTSLELTSDTDADPLIRSWALICMARAEHASGRSDEAEEQLEAAEERLARIAPNTFVVEIWQRLAAAWNLIGQAQRAIHAYQQALASAGHAVEGAPDPRPATR